MKPAAVMIHVSDIESAMQWYRIAFKSATLVHHEETKLAILDVDGFLVEIVKADSKVSSGKSGTVLYWSVPDLDVALTTFIQQGASLYRGPLVMHDGLAMCQLSDPFGNLIGLRGHTKK